MSFHFDNRWNLVLAVENGCSGYIHAQPAYELIRERGQPVGFVTCRNCSLVATPGWAFHLAIPNPTLLVPMLQSQWISDGDQGFFCVDRSIFDELTYDANEGQRLV